MKKLVWSRLKRMKCPQCGNPINKPVLSTDKYSCQNFLCDFTIGKQKFDEVVGNLYKPKFNGGNEDDNLAALNNL